jgi:molecular chaperone GrpE
MSDADLKVTDRRWWARGDSPSATDETPKLKPTYIEELEARIAAKDAELQQLLAKYRGAADEFEQVRGRRAVLGSFLDVLDNLDRAIAAAGDRADDPFVQGVALVRQQFLSTLEGLGVVRVDPIGQMFDPTKHEAVSTSPATDDTPTGQIVGVIRPGYLIGDEALRPAMVAVAG